MPVFGSPFGSPFYSGGGGTSLVPSRFHLGIAGQAFLLDLRREADFGHADIPIQRPQADTSVDPGAQSISTTGLWRRTVESWHRGAGQLYHDRREGDPFRFHTSEGVDPWTRYRLSLLPDVVDTTGGSSVIALLVVNDRLYAASSSAPFLRYTTDLASWTTVTGVPAGAPTSMTSDGTYVYTAHGTDGIYRSAVTGSTTASYVTGTVEVVGYVRGRLMAATDNLLYNILAAGALPAVLHTHPNTGFQWRGFGEAPGVILAFGDASGVALIYRTTIEPDGTGLDVPVAASPPITGAVYAMGNIADLGLIGGQYGWRPALFTDAGDVILGSLVETDSPVRALTVGDRFAWLGLTNYSATKTGVLRADLSTDTAAGTSRDGTVPAPAWATDLLATGQGTVTAVADFLGRRVFAVTGLGTFAAHATATVTTGTIDLGLIGWGIGDLKNALFADVRYLPLAAGAAITVEAAKDSGEFVVAGTAGTDDSVSAEIQLGQLRAETLGVRLILEGGATLTEVTLRAAPAADVGELYHLPMRLFDQDTDLLGAPFDTDQPAVLEYLRGLRATRQAVVVQVGVDKFTGIVEQLRAFRPESMAYDGSGRWRGWWNGVLQLVIKRV